MLDAQTEHIVGLAEQSYWYDSKRNGRVGTKALWQGWLKLAELVGYSELVISLLQTEDL
jgi:hypothetical protein